MPEKTLIIDDDIDALKLLGSIWQRQGHEISAALVIQSPLPSLRRQT